MTGWWSASSRRRSSRRLDRSGWTDASHWPPPAPHPALPRHLLRASRGEGKQAHSRSRCPFSPLRGAKGCKRIHAPAVPSLRFAGRRDASDFLLSLSLLPVSTGRRCRRRMRGAPGLHPLQQSAAISPSSGAAAPPRIESGAGSSPRFAGRRDASAFTLPLSPLPPSRGEGMQAISCSLSPFSPCQRGEGAEGG